MADSPRGASRSSARRTWSIRRVALRPPYGVVTVHTVAEDTESGLASAIYRRHLRKDAREIGASPPKFMPCWYGMMLSIKASGPERNAPGHPHSYAEGHRRDAILAEVQQAECGTPSPPLAPLKRCPRKRVKPIWRVKRSVERRMDGDETRRIHHPLCLSSGSIPSSGTNSPHGDHDLGAGLAAHRVTHRVAPFVQWIRSINQRP
jgi:hypothetical protein